MRETNYFSFFPHVKDTLGLSNNEYVFLNQITFLQKANPTGYCTYLGKDRTRPKQKFLEFLCTLIQREMIAECGEVLQKGFTTVGMRKLLKRLETRDFLLVDLDNHRVQTTAKFTGLVTTTKNKRDEITVLKQNKKEGEKPPFKAQKNTDKAIEELYETARVYWYKIKNPDEHMTLKQFDEFQKLLFDAIFIIRSSNAMTKELSLAIKDFEDKKRNGVRAWYDETMSIFKRETASQS
jgi:hypothetical protein